MMLFVAAFALATVCRAAGSIHQGSADHTRHRSPSWGGPLRQMFPKFEEKPFAFTDENPGNEALFLTPLLKKGKYKEAQQKAKVELKGYDVESYSGYFTVNKDSCGSNMFFWFFPAMYNTGSAPTLLWLQGGPGGSSLFGLFVEHGPFKVMKDMSLEPRPTTWALTHNLLYIDNPVGTGFSFTKSDACYAKNQVDVGSDLYEALQQFFTMFPHLRSNPFYVTGESYAGKYVPAISYKIHQEQSKANVAPKDRINFKGMAIGDGLCDPVSMTDYGDFLFQIGLIDEADRDYFKKVAAAEVQFIKQKQWVKAFQLFDDLLNGDLSGHPSYFANASGYNFYFNYLMTKQPDDMGYHGAFVQLPEVRRSIHVGNQTWNDGKKVETNLLNDVMQSVKPWIETLLEHYRVMIYNGLMDVIIAWPLTENFITSMKWSGAGQYLNTTRSQWHLGSELAGYAKQVGNFTQVVIRNAGHMVPYDQPEAAFDMISRFTEGKKFD